MKNPPFKIAMANDIHTGSYDPPLLNPDGKGREWLIIRRWGKDLQFLEIADTHIKPGVRGNIPNGENPDRAPDSLTAHNSMLGLMTRNPSDTDASFILVRMNPTSQPLDGKFYPVDGYARLCLVEKQWVLRASGRHAHHEGADIPYPTKGKGMSWHFDAKQLPWTHEET